MKSFRDKNIVFILVTVATQNAFSHAFIIPQSTALGMRKSTNLGPLFMAESEAENQVVELADDEAEEQQPTGEAKADDKTAAVAAAAPFISQGEISEEALTMDWSDPKQQRVMFYIILSLLPVLFLIPLMLGSRELVPPELLPPVQL